MNKLTKGQKACGAIEFLLENANGDVAAETMFEHAALLSYYPDDAEIAKAALDWFAEREDVLDGPYGEPRANSYMQCASEIRQLWGME